MFCCHRWSRQSAEEAESCLWNHESLYVTDGEKPKSREEVYQFRYDSSLRLRCRGLLVQGMIEGYHTCLVLCGVKNERLRSVPEDSSLVAAGLPYDDWEWIPSCLQRKSQALLTYRNSAAGICHQESQDRVLRV